MLVFVNCDLDLFMRLGAPFSIYPCFGNTCWGNTWYLGHFPSVVGLSLSWPCFCFEYWFEFTLLKEYFLLAFFIAFRGWLVIPCLTTSFGFSSFWGVYWEVFAFIVWLWITVALSNLLWEVLTFLTIFLYQGCGNTQLQVDRCWLGSLFVARSYAVCPLI